MFIAQWIPNMYCVLIYVPINATFFSIHLHNPGTTDSLDFHLPVCLGNGNTGRSLWGAQGAGKLGILFLSFSSRREGCEMLPPPSKVVTPVSASSF